MRVFEVFHSRLRSLGTALLAAVLLLPAHAGAQTLSSWVVADAHSTRILIEGNGTLKRPVDGFAAVATAVVTLDWAQRIGLDMGRLAAVHAEAVVGQQGNPMGLLPGDKLSYRDLIYSVLLGADDTACLTLAANVGQDLLMRRRKHGDPVAEFVGEMNALARQQGMSSTRFRSPHGGIFGRSRNGGHTTARDLARLGIYAMSRPAFRFYSMQSSRAVSVHRGAGKFRFRVHNFNPYAGKKGVDGVRVIVRGTGGPGAIISSKRSHEVVPLPDGRSLLYPRRVVSVAFGPDPVKPARQLLDAGWREFDQWSAQGRPFEQARTLNGVR